MNAIAEQLDHAIQLRYKRWKRARLPAYLRKELGELKAGEITDRFYKQLEFGTDGLREKNRCGHEPDEYIYRAASRTGARG